MMKIDNQIEDYRSILQEIVSRDCRASSKAALLRSLKESLQHQITITEKRFSLSVDQGRKLAEGITEL